MMNKIPERKNEEAALKKTASFFDNPKTNLTYEKTSIPF